MKHHAKLDMKDSSDFNLIDRKVIDVITSISEYNSLSDAAYLRAKEDYLIGINFSRLISLMYAKNLAKIMNEDRAVISIGRVMTCVLGLIVNREREDI